MATTPGGIHTLGCLPTASDWTLSDVRLTLARKRTVHRFHELPQIHRLGQVQIASRLARAGPGLFRSISAHGDDANGAELVFTLEPPANLVTVDTGQADIEKDNVRAKGKSDLERWNAVCGNLHLVPVVP